MFDSIIDEANQRFDLNGKADTLLSALLALITDKTHGGFPGFLARFDDAGLSGVTDSWLASGASTPISYEQTESALGEDLLKDLSARSGLEYTKTVSATAYMLPHVVDSLTPEGVVPEEEDLLSRVGTYSTTDDGGEGFTTPTAPVDRIGTAATDVVDADKASFAKGMEVLDDAGAVGTRVDTRVEPVGQPSADNQSVLNWLLPLLLLGLLLILGYWFCSGASETSANNVSKLDGTNILIIKT